MSVITRDLEFEPELHKNERDKVFENNVVRSPYCQSIDLVRNTSIPEFIWSEHEKFPHLKDALCLTCGNSGKSLDYQTLRSLSQRFGRALINIVGLKAGDVVGIVLPNCIEYAVVCLGVFEANGVISLLNPSYKRGEMESLMNLVSPSWIVTIMEHVPMILMMKEGTKSIKGVIVMDGEREDNSELFFYGDLLRSTERMCDNETLRKEEFTGDETAAILYDFSSGTTGLPKAVMLSHANICTNILQISMLEDHFQIKRFTESVEQDRYVVPQPLFHIFGFHIIMLCGFYRGTRMIVLSKFESASVVRCIEVYQPTVWFVVPPMLKYFVNSDKINAKDFVSVRSVMCGGAPCGDALERMFKKKFPKINMIRAFGLTETCGIVTVCSLIDARYSKEGSAGVLVPGASAKIENTLTGSVLGAGEYGELMIKSPQVMKGYLNNEEATDRTIDADGWLHTGDIAFYDRDGCFFIVDRLKDIIKYKGYQVSPSELENTLREMPGIQDVAVVGVKHDDEEVPKAFVVRTDSAVTEIEVMEFLSERLVDYKRLRGGVEFVENIKTSPSGKILRNEL